jgi:hypothetical protein
MFVVYRKRGERGEGVGCSFCTEKEKKEERV